MAYGLLRSLAKERATAPALVPEANRLTCSCQCPPDFLLFYYSEFILVFTNALVMGLWAQCLIESDQSSPIRASSVLLFWTRALLFLTHFLAIPCYCKMISSLTKRTPFSFYLISWTTSRKKNLLRTSHNCCFDFNHFCLNPNLPDFPSPSSFRSTVRDSPTSWSSTSGNWTPLKDEEN